MKLQSRYTLKPDPEPIREPACSGEPPNSQNIYALARSFDRYIYIHQNGNLVWNLIKNFAFEHYELKHKNGSLFILLVKHYLEDMDLLALQVSFVERIWKVSNLVSHV